MNEKKRFFQVFLPMLAAFLLPFVIVWAVALLLPPVYEDTFVGELSEKYDRLYSIEEPKIVIIAGSSSVYGLDSALIEEELGYKVVNFGLYANLGTKLMIDLSRDSLKAGDIVILAPEISSWTMSLGFNAETTAQSLDGSFLMARHLDGDEKSAITGALWSLAGNKLYYTFSGNRPENAEMYQKKYFNEYGDSEFPRAYNVMVGSPNPVSFDGLFDENYTPQGDFAEFLDYVNEYTAFAEGRGATVWYSFPPISADSVAAGQVTEESIDRFYTGLCLNLDCRIISDLRGYIMDPGYFYDSEFHLNDSGVPVRTVKLIDDIKRQLGIDDVTMRLSELPQPAGSRPDCAELTLEKINGGTAWTVASLSDEGAALADITIPDNVNGLPVINISSGAFCDCENLRSITLGGNVKNIENGAIEYCPNLVELIIPEGIEPDELSLPENWLGYGCAEDFGIYVTPADYDNYVFSKNTSNYAKIIAKIDNFTYRTENGCAILTGLGTSGKRRTVLTIPDYKDGLPVTAIDENAFDGAGELSEIRLGSNVRILAENCLSGLSSVTLRLAKGVHPDGYSLPDSFGQSDELTVIADWELYGEYLESDRFSGLRGSLICENEFLELLDTGDGWTVIGVNQRAAGLLSLSVPEEVDGKPVLTIAEGAFSDSGIETLTLSGSVQRLDGGALRGSQIKELIIPAGVSADRISVPNNMSESLATEGCRDGLKIVVPADLYEGYISDYFWGDYAKFLESAG